MLDHSVSAVALLRRTPLHIYGDERLYTSMTVWVPKIAATLPFTFQTEWMCNCQCHQAYLLICHDNKHLTDRFDPYG